MASNITQGESVDEAVARIFRPGDMGAVLRMIEFLGAAQDATQDDLKGKWFRRTFGAATLHSFATILQQHVVPALAKVVEGSRR